jgi:subtilisin family serine protease
MPKHAHLTLKRLEGELERRKPPGFGGGAPREPGVHGPKISQQVEAVIAAHQVIPQIEGVDPSLILRIEIAGFVDEAEWAKMGLIVLTEDEKKTLLLFATDKELQQFRDKIAAYQGELPLGQKNPSYANLIEAIENVGTALPEERLGSSLAAIGVAQPSDFKDAETYLLDVELFHPGDDMQASIFVYRLEQCLKAKGGIILNTYAGKTLLLCRVEAGGQAIREALNLPEVAAIELPPRPDLQSEDIGAVTVADIPAGSAPNGEAIAIGVIDSGINFGHPLLAYAMRGSIVGAPGWSDADENGHGTSVASMAAYGDVSSRTQEGDFDAPFWVASARVVDKDGQFPKAITVPEIMDATIRSLHEKHGCRIFNVSLGDPNLIYAGGRAGIWAATLDDLARELDIIIVVSTGNQGNLTQQFGEDILKQYPAYLMQPSSRLLDPATAANVITVGSIAHANGLQDADEELVGVRPICDADKPSPFTRAGPGVRGMIKPDLVDYGGNAVWDGPTKSLVTGNKKSSAGVWTFHHEPVDRLFRSRSGTSFAAPVVAHKAAIVLSQYPKASANFVRAMLALSGEIAEPTALALEPLGLHAPLMICGNGVANVDNAIGSDDSRVVFYADDALAPDHFAVFELPIPPIFQTTNGTREIKVALAFDPPVRRTRAEYLGLTMGWRLIRGTNSQDVFDKFRKWEKAEGEPPEFAKKFQCATFPGSTLREKGTLQCGSFTAKKNISEYGSTYYVAVWCRRRWAPATINSQPFSLAVQLRHSADIAVYQALTLPIALKA